MPQVVNRFTLTAGFVLALAAGPLLAQEPSGLETVAALETSLTRTIAGAEKSVVAIARVRKEQAGESVRKEFRPDAFNNQLLPTDPGFVPNEYGTGVVIDRRGLVLTAAHLLGGENDSYYVTTSERRVYSALIKAADPRSDLAVLSIAGVDGSSANLPEIRMGDSASLRKGQVIVTLGNPYAIARDGQASAGWGIVSNLGRKAPPRRDNGSADDLESHGEPLLERYGGLIQTDARLHLGASGGPLLNLKGEMVGLCISAAAVSGYETPAGYAIPVDAMFRRVLEVLKQGREAEYGFLGIEPANLTPEEVAAGRRGVRARRVDPNTPAFRAGLRDGDIIASVNDRPVHDTDGFVLEAGRLPLGAVARLDVLHDELRRTKEVVLGKFPVRGRKIVTVRPEPWRGIRVDYVSAYLEAGQPAKLYLITDEAVVVSDVDPNTAAALSGVKRGMLISQVDGRSVRTPRDFQSAVAGKSGAVQLKLASGDPAAPVLVVPPGS